MSQLLIHIGYHKTASTWMQNVLFGKCETFNNISEVAGASNYAEFLYRNEYGQVRSEHSLPSVPIVLAEKLKQTENNKVNVLSHERLSGNPHSGGFDSRSIANRIKHCFPDSKILLVIREQSDMAVSCYFQYLAEGGTLDFKDYLNYPYDGRKPGFSYEYLNYYNLAKYYYQIFGVDNVVVIPYETFKKSPDVFVKKIGDFLKVDIQLTPNDYNQKINSKSFRYVNYKLRLLNVFLKSDSINGDLNLNYKFLHYLAASVRKIYKLLISERRDKELVQDFRKYAKSQLFSNNEIRESNLKLAELIGFDLQSLGYLYSDRDGK